MQAAMAVALALSFVQPVQALGINPPDPNAQLPAYSGVEDSIREYLCTPDMGGIEEEILGDCLNKLYRFSISFGSIALVFFVVLAGYYYILGGESGKQKGKSIFISALTGMMIIVCSFLLLSFVNPDLVKFKKIIPPRYSDPGLPNCVDIGYSERCITPGGGTYQPPPGGGGGGGGGRCQTAPDSSPASVANLQNSCFAQMGSNIPTLASIVAQRESSGNPNIPVGTNSCPGGKSSRCEGGEAPVWGLFQINLTVHRVAGLNCPAAFNHEWKCSTGCRVVNQALYNQCVAAAKNPANNINAACAIARQCRAQGRPTFCAWGNTDNEHGRACGF